MYILLNIKDANKATEAITLLIKNGFTSMTTGKELREVCSECSSRAEIDMKNINLSLSSQTSIFDQILNSSQSQSQNFAAENKEQGCNGITAESLFSAAEDPETPSSHLMRSPAIPTTSFFSSPLQKKEARKKKIGENGEVAQLKRAKRNQPPKEGQQGLNCANCNAYITWGGSTPMANIERHVKLHASREQFSCSQCQQTFTRKYIAKQHVEQNHPPWKPGNYAEIIDHEEELRGELDELWQKCFPQIIYSEYKSKKKEFSDKRKQFEFEHLVRTMESATVERQLADKPNNPADIFESQDVAIKNEQSPILLE